MKKMMSMAFVAAMGMIMSVSAMAMKVASVDPTTISEMSAAASVATQNENLETRTMLYKDSKRTNKFVYLIGADGVVKSKTMYRYNDKTNEWNPVCIYRALYGDENNSIVCANWSEADQAYTADITVSTYTKGECPVLIKLPEIINY